MIQSFAEGDPKNSPLSPGGIKCFVHEGAGVDAEHPIGGCYVTPDNVTVEATDLHLGHPFIRAVTGCHYFIPDRELQNKGRAGRVPAALAWQDNKSFPREPSGIISAQLLGSRLLTPHIPSRLLE